MEKKDNPHAGHRQRKKEQFLRYGLDAFAPHEALELLLYYAIPRMDTNGIAHALLTRFGSLDGETLDTAMKALSMLQTSGRLVGIISHVSELKNRIPCQIQVTRDAAGFSHAAIRL